MSKSAKIYNTEDYDRTPKLTLEGETRPSNSHPSSIQSETLESLSSLSSLSPFLPTQPANSQALFLFSNPLLCQSIQLWRSKSWKMSEPTVYWRLKKRGSTDSLLWLQITFCGHISFMLQENGYRWNKSCLSSAFLYPPITSFTKDSWFPLASTPSFSILTAAKSIQGILFTNGQTWQSSNWPLCIQSVPWQIHPTPMLGQSS